MVIIVGSGEVWEYHG